MLKRIIGLMVFLLPVSVVAQTGAIEGYCNRGGQSATVSGLNSTNRFQNVINSCTISIYQTGTSTLVPGNQIFSNSTGTVLGNPFTADNATSLTPGKWLFFISTTTAVDVYGSGGIAPNTYAVPVPLCVDCYAPSGGMVYPGAGVANSTGSAWGTSYGVGTSANDLVQLNGSSQLPAVSGALLTNLPFMSLTTTGTSGAASLSSGGALNVPNYGAGFTSPQNSAITARVVWPLANSGWNSLEGYGDSVGAGVAADNNLLVNSNGFNNIVATYAGVSSGNVYNYSEPGTTPCAIAFSAFNYGRPAVGDGVLRNYEGGINALNYSYPALKQQMDCDLAGLSWLAAPASTKVTEANYGTLPANWSADTTTIPGLTTMTTTTNGAALPINCTGVATDYTQASYGYCMVWYVRRDGNDSFAGFTVTGALTNPPLTSLYSSPAIGGLAPGGGVPGGPAVIAIPLFSAGTTTITLTFSDLFGSGDAMTIIGVGTGTGMPPATAVDPVNFVGITYALNDQDSLSPVSEPSLSTTAQIYALQQATAYQAQQWGFNVYFVPTANCMFGNPAEIYTADPAGSYVHPSLLGHQEIANCIENYAQTTPVPSTIIDNSVAGSFNTLAGSGPWTLSPADQVVVIPAVGATSTAYLPILPLALQGKKTIKIYNASIYPQNVWDAVLDQSVVAPQSWQTYSNYGGNQWRPEPTPTLMESTTTPVVNTATCYKTVGPPPVIGYCSTALSGTPPTCTCN